MRGEALGAAQADRELEHFEPVQDGEGLGLAALDLERKGRARAPALAFEQRPIGMILGQKAQIPDGGDPRMALEEGGDRARALGRRGHPEL